MDMLVPSLGTEDRVIHGQAALIHAFAWSVILFDFLPLKTDGQSQGEDTDSRIGRPGSWGQSCRIQCTLLSRTCRSVPDVAPARFPARNI